MPAGFLYPFPAFREVNRMSQLRKHLRVLTALVMALALLVCAVPASIFAESSDTAEALEVVSSYPYTTTTKVKVNLRAGRSTRSTLIKKIPAKTEITVKAVKGSWAEVEYKKYSGYVKTDYIVLKEVKKVYAVTGIDISDKHVEVIIKQMLKKVIITDSGDSDYSVGQTVSQKKINEVLNQLLQERYNPAEPGKNEKLIGKYLFREGDKILQLKNRPTDDVYNGDIGILTEIDEKEKYLMVDYSNIYVFYEYEELSDIALAYAMSVHKSQGSEYPIVYFVISKNNLRMLNRKLIYTAISRAKNKLVIIGDSALFMQGLSYMMKKRNTTLIKRLMENG